MPRKISAKQTGIAGYAMFRTRCSGQACIVIGEQTVKLSNLETIHASRQSYVLGQRFIVALFIANFPESFSSASACTAGGGLLSVGTA